MSLRGRRRSDAVLVEHRREDLGRGVAGAGPETGAGAVEVGGARVEGGDGVRGGEGQVVVGVEAQRYVDRLDHGADPDLHVLGQHRAGRVGDVDGVGAVGLEHEPACSATSPAVFMWVIIRKPTASMPSSLASLMCCSVMSASVQWVAIRTTCAPLSRPSAGRPPCRCPAAAGPRAWPLHGGGGRPAASPRRKRRRP